MATTIYNHVNNKSGNLQKSEAANLGSHLVGDLHELALFMKLQGSLVSLCGLQQDAVVEELGFVALLRRLLLQLALELLALDGPDVRLQPPHSYVVSHSKQCIN